MKKTQKKKKRAGEDLMHVKTKPLKSRTKKLKKKKLVTSDDINHIDEETVQVVKGLPVAAEKVPKIRRTAVSENIEENFMIVPWASREEWENVCFQFHERNYKQVITKIGMWQKRVPTLPVGVEATLFLLEALVYDEKFAGSTGKREFYTEDQARSLYSLAIIRYLNHVSQLATQSLGGSSKKLTRELAAIVDTPEWLVSLRNEVSHAPSAPSIEVLRMGGDFVLQWLKEKYWKLPEETVITTLTTNDPFTIVSNTEEVNNSLEISELFGAYIASRIHKLRKQLTIYDPEILRHIPNNSTSVKTKVAVMTLKISLRRYIVSHPSLFCEVVSQELIPNFEFYQDFKSILKYKEDDNRDDFAFSKLYGLWMPIVKLLESKGKLISILNNLAQVIINPECEKMWELSARWIDKFLEIIEYSGKKYSKHLVSILGVVIKHPNPSMEYFLERLFRLTEVRLGSETVQKLAYLAAIWIQEKPETKKRRKPSVVKLFTLSDISEESAYEREEVSNSPSNNENGEESSVWISDKRNEEFWRAIPLGGML